MTKEELQLVKQFNIIANKKWIKADDNTIGGIGITFEKELKKKPDSTYFPDYNGIEIKCTSRFSRYPVTLFSIAFDGPTFPEINRIVKKYGYKDYKYSKKIFYVNLKCNEKTELIGKNKFSIEISDEEEKMYLCVYNKKDKLVEKKSYIYISSIYNHLMVKLQRLAIIKASKKAENEDTYYRYYKMDLYNLISFENFIKLLKEGIININLVSRISRSGPKEGEYRNKNLVFQIDKENLQKMYKLIYSHNVDLDTNFFSVIEKN